MSDGENCVPTNKRTPWNKGKLIGARLRCAQSTFGQSGLDCCYSVLGIYARYSSFSDTQKLKVPSDTSALR
jgi:hypothetical protein